MGLLMVLAGAGLVETPIVGYLHGENDIGSIIFSGFCGLIFLIPGILLIYWKVKDIIQDRGDPDVEKIKEVLNPGFQEAVGGGKLDRQLVSFRDHYSEFFDKDYTVENEEIQKDVTQIFRNMMQFRKNRLNRLGLTCEMQIRRMAYTKEDGIHTRRYSDGKYKMTDVTEEVAARTTYKKNNQPIYTKTDKETANYTIIEAKKVGKDTMICPNCGATTTRQDLLDGCDYCGAKFKVEDLGASIASFAFRADEKLRAEKRRRTINRIWTLVMLGAIAFVVIGFIGYAIHIYPEILAEANGGVILTILSGILSVIVASPAYIVSYVLVYPERVLPVLLVMALISVGAAMAVKSKRKVPAMSMNLVKEVRQKDPNFSIAHFYSDLQNKLSSVLFADNKAQINAFAQGDLSHLLNRYQDVIGVDVDQMLLNGYTVDDAFQYADVKVLLMLTRLNEGKCTVEKETMQVRLVKDAACKTQAVCSPTMMVCQNCGAPMDLLRGKQCYFCDHELNLIKHDWVIQEIQV